MALANNVVGSLDIGNQHVSVLDIDPEFSLQGFVDMHAGFDVDVATFVSPVRVEGNGHSLSQ